MMPFFTIPDPRMGHPLPMPVDQIESRCRQRTIDELLHLKDRMQAFYDKESKNRREARAQLELIPSQISELQAQLEKNRQDISDAEKRNEELQTSLPGNGAERHLARQQFSIIPRYRFDLEEKIKNLQATQKRLEKDVAWIDYEFVHGNKEFPAVCRVIVEKTPEMAPDSAPPTSRRM
ncbi:hypothetical protein [Legionella sp. km772]|uniref:hypothetical protein n=1 Tax=Legionella sp. km772 TaxID=2498111 RepID=UPI000FBC0F01|nr:hypothetical protein [Legionella sp. km772]RUR11303.1 hypothetical protein ELY15_07220 [Legionella sp. km772]